MDTVSCPILGKFLLNVSHTKIWWFSVVYNLKHNQISSKNIQNWLRYSNLSNILQFLNVLVLMDKWALVQKKGQLLVWSHFSDFSASVQLWVEILLLLCVLLLVSVFVPTGTSRSSLPYSFFKWQRTMHVGSSTYSTSNF